MIRSARREDIDAIMHIVSDAQLALAELGIDQWQDGYPSQDVILSDICEGNGYVAVDESDRPIAYAAILFAEEPAYRQIADEQWNTPNSYVVVHRLCVGRTARRKGLAGRMMRYAADLATQRSIYGFRIDTHEGNIRMLSMLRKLGFQPTGTIYYPSGKRIAFDLKLSLANRD